MKFNKWTMVLAAVALAMCGVTSAMAQTNGIGLPSLPPGVNVPSMNPNGLDFTNVSWSAESGMSYDNSGGGVTANVEAAWDFKKLSSFDLGLSANGDFSATGPGFSGGSIDMEAIKNFSNFQIVGKLGPGLHNTGRHGGYIDGEVDVNYNLSAGITAGSFSTSNGFTFVGVGYDWKQQTHGDQQRTVKVYVGWGF
jgi:hypothetical protein